MIVLGIETSCDETAAAVVADGRELLSNVVASSMDLHAAYGGVVPEIAARSHIESIMPVIDSALEQAFPEEGADPWSKIDAVAVTCGPGLGGSLLVGVMTARTLAILKKKPLYAVNHVLAHCYANFLTSTALPGYTMPDRQPDFPFLALIVSGGHSQLVLFRDHFDYELLGRTNDDAVGEAFDKVAKILGLPYPGGPSVAEKAASGNPSVFNFPKASMQNFFDFSFSGLKTAVLRAAQAAIGENFTFPSHQIAERLTDKQKADIAAGFQRAAIETLVDKTILACEKYSPANVVVGGGVAASRELRRQLSDRISIQINYSDFKLCTDNGAMIAAAGFYMHKAKIELANPYSLEIYPNLSM